MKKKHFSEIERIKRGKHGRGYNIQALMVFGISYSCGQEVQRRSSSIIGLSLVFTNKR